VNKFFVWVFTDPLKMVKEQMWNQPDIIKGQEKYNKVFFNKRESKLRMSTV